MPAPGRRPGGRVAASGGSGRAHQAACPPGPPGEHSRHHAGAPGASLDAPLARRRASGAPRPPPAWRAASLRDRSRGPGAARCTLQGLSGPDERGHAAALGLAPGDRQAVARAQRGQPALYASSPPWRAGPGVAAPRASRTAAGGARASAPAAAPARDPARAPGGAVGAVDSPRKRPGTPCRPDGGAGRAGGPPRPRPPPEPPGRAGPGREASPTGDAQALASPAEACRRTLMAGAP